MKASDLFVKCLEEEAVTHIFGVPGEENLDLVESLRNSRIQLVVTRHEQHAAIMAATYGRLTGRAGVCLSTLGPGATNLVTGVAYAQLGGMPLLAVTGQKGIKENWQGNFQIIDVVGTLRPLTKWNTTIVNSNTIPRNIRHAFRMAESERPGAVHLELPEDVASETVSARPYKRIHVRRPVPDQQAIEKAIALIKSARNPLVIYSSGANRKRVGKQLKEFVEKLSIYAIATQMGKGVLRDDHPYSLFSMGIHKRDYVHNAFDTADLVITVGYNIAEYPPYVWNGNNEKRVLHIDFNAAEPDEYYSPELEVVGDISNALWSIHSQAGDLAFDNAHMAALRTKIDNKLHHSPCAGSYPAGPRRIVYDVREVMEKKDIICLDNGIYKVWFARMYKAYADNTVLLDNTLATMGAGLGSAMAAKMVYPDSKVMAICGDGGFMMNSQDLETAVRLRLDLVVLILRDDAYGFIKWKQSGMNFEDFGMDFGNPDFVKYAEAYGAKGLRVDESHDLQQVLRKAFTLPGPILVDCPIDYSENEILNHDLAKEL